jgi:stage V sporulation protein B
MVREKTREKQGLLRSAALLTGVNLVAQAMGFLTRIGISRLAGAEVMGVYQLLMPAYSVLSAFAISGLAVSVSALTGQLEGRGAGSGQLVTLALRGLGLLWSLAAAVVILRGDWISTALLGDARTWLGLLLLLPCLMLTGVENIQKHWFYGRGLVSIPGRVELGEQGVRTAAVLLLLSAVPTATIEEKTALIVVGMLVSELFSAASLTIARLRQPREKRTPVPGLTKKLVRTATPMGLAAVVGSLLAALNAVMIPRRLIASGVAADQAVGEYGILFGMTLPLLSAPSCFVGALCTVLLPDLSRHWAEGKTALCRQRIYRALMGVAALVFPILAGIAALGQGLGTLLFHEARAGEHLALLAVAVGCSAWNGVAAAALNGLGQQPKSAALSILCGVAELVPTWYLTGQWGLSGCIWAMVGVGVVETGLRLLLLVRSGGLEGRNLLGMLSPALAAVAMGVEARLLANLFQGWNAFAWTRMAACICFSGLSYLLLLGLLVFSTETSHKEIG